MTEKAKPSEDFRMSAKEFDRIMGKALRTKPEGGKTKKRPKAKTKKRPRR